MPKGNILFIDDDTFLRKVYQSELTDKGFTVSLAADGEEGLTKMKSEGPDLVILDLIMPKKSGFEILADVQHVPQLAAIPIIVLSNLAQSEDQERALGLGAVDYLIKDNTTLDVIADKIAYHLSPGGKKLRRSLNSAVTEGVSVEKSAPDRPAIADAKHTVDSLEKRTEKNAASAVPGARGHNFCPQCGYALATGAKFCPDCGMKII